MMRDNVAYIYQYNPNRKDERLVVIEPARNNILAFSMVKL
jgi:hypothetical protein